jgi:23S rRNA (guanosine2251-2'-O)-methyltransferase
MEILYGFHPVSEALRAGRRTVEEIYLSGKADGQRRQQLKKMTAERGIQTQTLSEEALARKCGSHGHQGIAARTSVFPVSDFDASLTRIANTGDHPFIIVVDSVQDPHNLGAIIRTAVAVDAHAVIIPKDRAAGPIPSVSKASAGALEHMHVIQVTNLARALDALRKTGLWIIGTEMSAASSLFSCDLKGPLALVIGGEEKGLRPLVKKKCDRTIAIPQSDKIDSLNAAVAGAVVMYEAFRQRTSTQD